MRYGSRRGDDLEHYESKLKPLPKKLVEEIDGQLERMMAEGGFKRLFESSYLAEENDFNEMPPMLQIAYLGKIREEFIPEAVSDNVKDWITRCSGRGDWTLDLTEAESVIYSNLFSFLTRVIHLGEPDREVFYLGNTLISSMAVMYNSEVFWERRKHLPRGKAQRKSSSGFHPDYDF